MREYMCIPWLGDSMYAPAATAGDTCANSTTPPETPPDKAAKPDLLMTAFLSGEYQQFGRTS